MDGAQPRSRPVTPQTPGNMTIILRELGGDAMFSAATFAVLLVPITGYGVIMRQRERREAEEAAERSERDAAAAGMPPDPLLEFFAPLQPRPADLPGGAGPSASPRFQARPGLTGRSTMSTPLSNRSAFTPSPQPSPPRERSSQERLATSATEATASSSHAIQVAGIGSDSVRRTEVSGDPPWEPASRPTTELPWAVISASGSTRTPGTDASSPAIPPPPDSVWDSAPAPARPSSAPESLFEPTSAPPPRSSQPRDAAPPPRPAPPQPPPPRQTSQPPQPQPRQPQPRQGTQSRQTQPRQGTQSRQTQPRQVPPPQPPSPQPPSPQTQPRQTQRRQTQPTGQSRRAAGQSRRGGAATPPVPTPAPMPAPVPQPTSWQDLPGPSDGGPIFAWNPVSDDDPDSDRMGDLPRRNRRSKH